MKESKIVPKAQAEQANEMAEKRKRESPRDHSGEEYSDLKILRLDTDSGHGDVYICKCKKCGWEGSVRLDSIKKYGHTTKCNCGKDREIVIGNTYGKLTVLKRDMSVQNVPPTKFKYICKCVDCGWEGSLRYDTVKSGKNLSMQLCYYSQCII